MRLSNSMDFQEKKTRTARLGCDVTKLAVASITHSEDKCIDVDPWSINYLIDIMKKHLATVKHQITNTNEGCDRDNRVVDSRKYYDQAYKMLKIGAFMPAPPYVIFLRDLTPKIIKELYHLDGMTGDTA